MIISQIPKIAQFLMFIACGRGSISSDMHYQKIFQYISHLLWL